jgi:integrase
MRSDAARLARVDEFDLTARIWTMPKSRMKALGRDQRVPLGERAAKIVTDLKKTAGGGVFLFGGARPICKNAVGRLLVELLRAIGHEQHAVAHGFRSAFKDWAHETRDYPTEVVEQALGHRIKSSVERAYRRGDLLQRRKVLMADWESYCSGGAAGGGEVLQLRA